MIPKIGKYYLCVSDFTKSIFIGKCTGVANLSCPLYTIDLINSKGYFYAFASEVKKEIPENELAVYILEEI